MTRPKAPEEFVDPRIRRSRQMLKEALAKLLEEKDFNAISVQDITERATVNRATFYDHYPDKSALVEDMVRDRFDELLAKRQLSFDASSNAGLRAIVATVCDFLLPITVGCGDYESRRNLELLIQTTVIDRIRSIFSSGLKEHQVEPEAKVAFFANVISWLIYGAVANWVRDDKRPPQDEHIEAVCVLVETICSGLRS
jgi:AcrR family transcriptional regulator